MSVQVAFYKGKTTFFDRLVQWWTKSPYSHCEVILEDYPVVLGPTTPVRCASSSWPDGGVRIKLIHLKPEHWDVITVPNTDVALASQWFYQRRGDKYDLLSLLGLVVRPVGHNTKRWNCVEACASALGFIDTWRLTVADFYELCYAVGRQPFGGGKG